MHHSLPIVPASPPFSGNTDRLRLPGSDATLPRFTSGFGTVMEQEREIQTSTAGYLVVDDDSKSAALRRILHHQQTRLDANITLLEERYQMLPHPMRFDSWSTRKVRSAFSPIDSAPAAADRFLPELVAQHLLVLRNINALIDQRLAGHRGKLILAEIARNHEDMAWMLTALIKENESVRDLIPTPILAIVPPPSVGEANWENEGGAVRGATTIKST